MTILESLKICVKIYIYIYIYIFCGNKQKNNPKEVVLTRIDAVPSRTLSWISISLLYIFKCLALFWTIFSETLTLLKTQVLVCKISNFSLFWLMDGFRLFFLWVFCFCLCLGSKKMKEKKRKVKVSVFLVYLMTNYQLDWENMLWIMEGLGFNIEFSFTIFSQ